ncbi:hypothetical protein ACH5RR_015671 [Cinchona calisaya]|uniref:RNase H type-1 domain-containing protein n=1 Tax=Cinchona calisaya TaxID=153742 RepID=A0ABD2ZTT8_9GENT
MENNPIQEEEDARVPKPNRDRDAGPPSIQEPTDTLRFDGEEVRDIPPKPREEEKQAMVSDDGATINQIESDEDPHSFFDVDDANYSLLERDKQLVNGKAPVQSTLGVVSGLEEGLERDGIEFPVTNLTIAEAWNGQNWNEEFIISAFPNFNMQLLVGKSICLDQGHDSIVWKVGGGVIRDSIGNLVAAFSSFYAQIQMNLFAELVGVLDDLRLCKKLNLQKVIIGSRFDNGNAYYHWKAQTSLAAG